MYSCIISFLALVDFVLLPNSPYIVEKASATSLPLGTLPLAITNPKAEAVFLT